jgi:hypothetical protein
MTRSVNWRVNAIIKRTCARMPIAGPYLYDVLLRTCGGLRNNDPREYFLSTARMLRELRNAHVNYTGARVMELGTGWDFNLAIGLYLCGVGEILEFDLYRNLMQARVQKSLDYIRSHEEEVVSIFGNHADPKRMQALKAVHSTHELMKLANIKYHAPSDATDTSLSTSSIDMHISFNVFEHVSPEILHGILVEAARLLKPSGAALHQFDLSDHFAHTNPNLTYIDFLKYSKDEWSSIAGNRFAYTNRLRPAEFRAIYSRAGHEIINWRANIDQRSLNTLRAGFPLHADYISMPLDELSTITLVITSRPSTKGSAIRINPV